MANSPQPTPNPTHGYELPHTKSSVMATLLSLWDDYYCLAEIVPQDYNPGINTNSAFYEYLLKLFAAGIYLLWDRGYLEVKIDGQNPVTLSYGQLLPYFSDRSMSLRVHLITTPAGELLHPSARRRVKAEKAQ